MVASPSVILGLQSHSRAFPYIPVSSGSSQGRRHIRQVLSTVLLHSHPIVTQHRPKPSPRSVTNLASRAEPLPAASAPAPELRLCSEGIPTREYNPI